METNKKAIKLFMIIVTILSAVWEIVIILTKQMNYAAFLMWVPATGAWIARWVYFRKEKHSLLFRKCKFRYIVYAMLLPLIYFGIPYVTYWIMKPGTMQIEWNVSILSIAVFGTAISMLTALGEEIGWRGFLVPRLLTCIGWEKTLLLSGLIWGLWHCPLLISGIYMPGTPVWFKVPMFILQIGSVGVMIGILTLLSQSVWPAAIMHAAHNNYDQTILGSGTVGLDKMYFVSETGILTVVVSVALAAGMYLFYKKYLKKQAEQHLQETCDVQGV